MVSLNMVNNKNRVCKKAGMGEPQQKTQPKKPQQVNKVKLQLNLQNFIWDCVEV